MKEEIDNIINDIAANVTSNVKSMPVIWVVDTDSRYGEFYYTEYSLEGVNRLYYVKFKDEIYYGIDESELENNPDNYSLFNKTIQGTKGVKWTKSQDNLIKYLTYLFEIVDDYTQKMLNGNWDINRYYNFEEGLRDVKRRTELSKKKGKIHKLEEVMTSIVGNVKERQESIKRYEDDIQRWENEIEDLKKNYEEVDKELRELENE